MMTPSSYGPYRIVDGYIVRLPPNVATDLPIDVEADLRDAMRGYDTFNHAIGYGTFMLLSLLVILLRIYIDPTPF